MSESQRDAVARDLRFAYANHRMNMRSNVFEHRAYVPDLPGVYFVCSAGLVKIGHSARSISDRVKTIQTSSPGTVAVLAFVVCLGEGKSARFEAALHARFFRNRVRGEWFAPTAELMAVIARIRSVAERVAYSEASEFLVGGAPYAVRASRAPWRVDAPERANDARVSVAKRRRGQSAAAEAVQSIRRARNAAIAAAKEDMSEVSDMVSRGELVAANAWGRAAGT